MRKYAAMIINVASAVITILLHPPAIFMICRTQYII